MKLFWTPASPFVRKVMVTAIELGLDERIVIHPTYWPHEWGSRTIEFDPEFIAANPVGRIPALVTEEGIALVESNLICEYLQTRVSAPALRPPVGNPRWQDTRLLGIVDGALEAMIARRAEMLREEREQSSGFVAKQRDRIARCFDSLEQECDAFERGLTLAQITTGVACGYMDFRYPSDQWRISRSRLSDWYMRFAERPSMKRTIPSETPQRDKAR
ncbi:MAG TPA: glutathione S-transferase N-terminal domain-containing protein [Terriglobales bacterium]|nr:glutathione S-transferase N-terminal domain-containing protein [Terriglobales bacterium]